MKKIMLLLVLCMCAAMSVQAVDRWAPTTDRLLKIKQRAVRDYPRHWMKYNASEKNALYVLSEFRPPFKDEDAFERICDYVERVMPNSYVLQLHLLKDLCLRYVIAGELPPDDKVAEN